MPYHLMSAVSKDKSIDRWIYDTVCKEMIVSQENPSGNWKSQPKVIAEIAELKLAVRILYMLAGEDSKRIEIRASTITRAKRKLDKLFEALAIPVTNPFLE